MVNGFQPVAIDAIEARTNGAADGAYAPFPAFLSGFQDHVTPFLGDITEEVVHAIRTQIPEYARPMDDTYMHVVRRGVEQALDGFMARMARPEAGWESVKATYQRIGRGEAEEGRSLDTFQSALRLGARVAWRRVNALVDADLLPPRVLAAFGEALFLHLDEMAAATIAGYTEARLHAAGELQLRRTRLIDLLTADPPASAEAISDLAHAAQWPVPRELAIVVTAGTPVAPVAPGTNGTGDVRGDVRAGNGHGELRPIVPPEFLARFDQQPGCVVVPDPDGPGRAAAVARALRGLHAVVGPTVALNDGARSRRWAADAMELSRRGILPGPGPEVLYCADHLTTLLLFREEALVDALAERHLRPLERIRLPHRDRLAETLMCWLQSGQKASEVAVRLAIHPQTVRYRLRQLEEVFGEALHDPTAQFEMQLALRALSLRSAAAPDPYV